MSAQMVSSHNRPHNRNSGRIPYYIAAALTRTPEEASWKPEFSERCAMFAFGCRKPRSSYPTARPIFRVRGKTFPTYVVNHHGDGRVPLWLNAAPGAPGSWVGADPDRFFVPPSVGARGG